MFYLVIKRTVNFIIDVSEFSIQLLLIIMAFNVCLILYSLYYKIQHDIRGEMLGNRTISRLNLNIFYLMSRNFKGTLYLTEEDKEISIKETKNTKTLISIFSFLLLVNMCSQIPLQSLYKQDCKFILLYLFSYLYLFRGRLCVAKSQNDRAYSFPLIFNPFARHRFYKRYYKFMKKARELLNSCEKPSYEIVLDELSYNIKVNWNWISAKKAGGLENYVEEQILSVVSVLLSSGDITKDQSEKIVEKLV